MLRILLKAFTNQDFFLKVYIFYRFMVANRKIKSGEIIFREIPAFVGPTTNEHDHIGAQKCVGCFDKFGKCSKESESLGHFPCLPKFPTHFCVPI